MYLSKKHDEQRMIQDTTMTLFDSLFLYFSYDILHGGKIIMKNSFQMKDEKLTHDIQHVYVLHFCCL